MQAGGSVAANDDATTTAARRISSDPGVGGIAMRSPFLRSHPNFRARRVGRHESACAAAEPTRASASASPFLGTMSRRAFADDAQKLLRDSSPLREPLLLALSHGRSVEAASCARDSERARQAAFESAYLSLAALLAREQVAGAVHPTRTLVEGAMRVVHLIPEDRYLSIQLTSLYGMPGWETLDLDAVMEWCARVRLAVAARLDPAAAADL